MIKTIAIIIVVPVAAVLIFAATRPDSFRVERAASVKAPPEKVFALINDLRTFNTWNPYEKKDPGIRGSYNGPAAGTGAAYAWESEKVGVGRLEIASSAPPSKVTMKLDFVKPFEAHNTAELTLAAQGDSTLVTWAMYGPSTYVSKLIGVFFNLDRMVGQDFEQGLANLKAVAEK